MVKLHLVTSQNLVKNIDISINIGFFDLTKKIIQNNEILTLSTSPSQKRDSHCPDFLPFIKHSQYDIFMKKLRY